MIPIASARRNVTRQVMKAPGRCQAACRGASPGREARPQPAAGVRASRRLLRSPTSASNVCRPPFDKPPPRNKALIDAGADAEETGLPRVTILDAPALDSTLVPRIRE